MIAVFVPSPLMFFPISFVIRTSTSLKGDWIIHDLSNVSGLFFFYIVLDGEHIIREDEQIRPKVTQVGLI